MRARAAAWVVAGAVALAGCSRERRVIEADQPVTAPSSAADPRAAQFRDNAFQVAQGGRYFSWYGCGGCHGRDARRALDLSDDRWQQGKAIDRVFAAIGGHGTLGQRIPTEQRWQLAGYVLQLPELDPAYRRRQDLDAVGEAQAGSWSGPVR